MRGYAGGDAQPEAAPRLPSGLGGWSWLCAEIVALQTMVSVDRCTDCGQAPRMAGRSVCRDCRNRRALAAYHAKGATTVAERRLRCAK